MMIFDERMTTEATSKSSLLPELALYLGRYISICHSILSVRPNIPKITTENILSSPPCQTVNFSNFRVRVLLFVFRFNILSRFSVAGCVVESDHVLSVNRRLPQCEGDLPEHVFFGIRHPLSAESKDELMGANGARSC